MTKTLAIFPLHLVAYPGEEINLHIFEERYKELINDCIDHNKTFGLPAYIDDKVKDVGTEMQVVKVFKKYPKGEMDIRVLGLQPFEILELINPMPGKLFAGAKVSMMEELTDSNEDLSHEIKVKMDELFVKLGVEKKLLSTHSFHIAHYLGMPVEKEYELLAIVSERKRQDKIINHLNTIIPMVEATKKIQAKIKMNGHFQEFDPLKF